MIELIKTMKNAYRALSAGNAIVPLRSQLIIPYNPSNHLPYIHAVELFILETMGKQNFPKVIKQAHSPTQAVEEADIICTATILRRSNQTAPIWYHHPAAYQDRIRRSIKRKETWA